MGKNKSWLVMVAFVAVNLLLAASALGGCAPGDVDADLPGEQPTVEAMSSPEVEAPTVEVDGVETPVFACDGVPVCQTNMTDVRGMSDGDAAIGVMEGLRDEMKVFVGENGVTYHQVVGANEFGEMRAVIFVAQNEVGDAVILAQSRLDDDGKLVMEKLGLPLHARAVVGEGGVLIGDWFVVMPDGSERPIYSSTVTDDGSMHVMGANGEWIDGKTVWKAGGQENQFAGVAKMARLVEPNKMVGWEIDTMAAVIQDAEGVVVRAFIMILTGFFLKEIW